jgi:transposase-like protein
MTCAEWDKAFPDERSCAAYLVFHRWQGAVVCPRCGNPKVYTLAIEFHWQCHQCAKNGYRFSVIAGTIFENTNKPLRDWFRVIHMMLTAKKGVSALQIYRTLGFGSYKTAWYMCHRVRVGLANEEFRKLIGIVECDETYVGGKRPNRHKDQRGSMKGKGRNAADKAIIAGAIERQGNVVARVIANVSADVLTRFLREAVSDKVSLICTDQWHGYANVRDVGFPHAWVNHSVGEYARYDDELVGAVHTNTIEGFWSLIKRGVVGTYHKVSRKYLPLYVAEFQFRYNNRSNPDIFGEAIRGC